MKEKRIEAVQSWSLSGEKGRLEGGTTLIVIIRAGTSQLKPLTALCLFTVHSLVLILEGRMAKERLKFSYLLSLPLSPFWETAPPRFKRHLSH
jgi:hypothetical protein